MPSGAPEPNGFPAPLNHKVGPLFSKYEHELMGPVSLVAPPVFVVFFTNAGASIDIARTLRLLPIALALSALRALGLWGAAGLGARVGGEAAPIRRYSWLGYVPQAGVTLGLVAIAPQQLPMLAESIAGLGMAVEAINLLVGPLTLRLALTKLGGEQAPADRDSRRTPSRLSGMPLDFQSEFGFRWLRLLGSDSEPTLYFRLLRRMTNGNLALARKVFLASVQVVAGGFLVRTEHPLSVDLSFLGELDTQQLAALNQALRFGGVDGRSLQGAGEVPSGVEVHLAFLRTIGLLIAEGPRRGLLSIPADLRPLVEQALAQRGAGSAGEA